MSSMGSWTSYPPLAVARLLKAHRELQHRRGFDRQGQGGLSTCAWSQRRSFCLLPGGRAGDASWDDRELEVEVWLEATVTCAIPLFISLETHTLLQRRLQDARTMKPFAEMFRVADSDQGLLGQEPAVCTGAFPIAGPSGEACSEK